MGFWINLAGLFFAGIGALLLIFFSLPPLDVTADGQRLAGWSAKPADTAVVERNQQKYKRHHRWSAWGLRLLVAGFALQVAGTLIEHFC